MRILTGIALAFALCACAAGPPLKPEAPPTRPADCESLYVILPANFIIDLAAGSYVTLDPAYQEFALFCSASEAQKIMERYQKENKLPPGSDWRVYRLDGTFEQLVESCNNGEFCLSARARVVDWVEPAR